ncbi:hypothetical protein C2G38_2222548 [Gigaspora rosea]|uniref:Uncharacterized protein n=1 Tax=Gigaspora rosea TaxID=44941 RepID=A0A397U5P9_9GLOM|nr:hypothetical protein C2G38_2222548 [Gigaspora rosea]
MQKLPAILESLDDDTKKHILEWGDKIRSKYNSDNNSDSDDDDDNVIYYEDPILAIEWNEAALIQRNVQKNTILIYIRAFQGVMPFPNNVRPQLDSLFYAVSRPGVPAQQIFADIMYGLSRTYNQQGPALGRLYVVNAERKDKFEAVEYCGIFAP